jgi:predicted Zn-dependent protease
MAVSSVACGKRRATWNPLCVAIFCPVMLGLFQCAAIHAQVAPGRQQISSHQDQSSPPGENASGLASQSEAEGELQTGTALTRKGSFREAIPHLVAASKQVANEYPANFNLALCYVATSQFRLAIEVLHELRDTGQAGVDVENLIAQAYIGNAQPQEALAAVQKGATRWPQNEKLYVFVADACMDHRDYRLGLEVIDIGLGKLPRSARLHYDRAMFLTQLDQLDQAKPHFDLVGKLAPGSEIAYMAAAQKELFEGDILGAIRSARDGVKQGYGNPALLTVLGESLIRSGVTPGQSEFAEAQTALEKAVTQRPNDPATQIALGSLYLTAGRLDDAITHLEMARLLEPGKASVYARLARAYQRHGDQQQAQEALAILERLNREQADHIRSAPGDRKLGYAGRAAPEKETVPPHP